MIMTSMTAPSDLSGGVSCWECKPEALNYNILCARQVRGYNHRGPAGLCRPERHQESLKVHRQGEGCAQGLSVLGFRERCRLSLHRHNRVTAPRIVSGCLCTGYRHFSLSGNSSAPIPVAAPSSSTPSPSASPLTSS